MNMRQVCARAQSAAVAERGPPPPRARYASEHERQLPRARSEHGGAGGDVHRGRALSNLASGESQLCAKGRALGAYAPAVAWARRGRRRL